MQFKFGKLKDGNRKSEEVVEYDTWFDAVDALLAFAGFYLVELDEEGNEVV